MPDPNNRNFRDRCAIDNLLSFFVERPFHDRATRLLHDFRVRDRFSSVLRTKGLSSGENSGSRTGGGRGRDKPPCDKCERDKCCAKWRADLISVVSSIGAESSESASG